MSSTYNITSIYIRKKMNSGFPNETEKQKFVTETMEKLDMFLLMGRIDSDEYELLVGQLGTNPVDK